MKKIILLLGMLVAVNSACFAACDYSCVTPYNMNTKTRTFFSAISGYNSIVENSVEATIKKEILKFASADNLYVDLESYSPGDLRNGIFKSIEIKANNVLINDIHLTSLDLRSLCDFNYIKQSGSDVVFMEDFPMEFNMVMTQDVINKTMTHARYQNIIKELNRLANSYGVGLQIASTKVAIKANKFYYIIGFNVPFVKREQKIVLETDIRVKNGKVALNNTRLVSGPIKLDLKKIDFMMNYLNPLDFSVKILENKEAQVNVKNIEIKDNNIIADGIIIIPKD